MREVEGVSVLLSGVEIPERVVEAAARVFAGDKDDHIDAWRVEVEAALQAALAAWGATVEEGVGRSVTHAPGKTTIGPPGSGSREQRIVTRWLPVEDAVRGEARPAVWQEHVGHVTWWRDPPGVLHCDDCDCDLIAKGKV